MTDQPQETGRPAERMLIGVALAFLLYLVYLFFAGFQGQVAERYQIEPADHRTAGPASGSRDPSAPVIVGAAFDEQGFPVRPRPDQAQPVPGQLLGAPAVLGLLRQRLADRPPEQILKDYQGQLARYWMDPGRPEFVARSREVGRRLEATAARNRKLVQSLVDFLEGDAGRLVSTLLKENLAKAAQSPARAALASGFSAWRTGDLEQAWRLLQQAETLDPDSAYIQIVAHQGMAFLNMERHGPLEETMRQYRDLAEEAHRYIKTFKPVLEKAGFDPVKLYGRDPFDASGLPTRAQFERALNDSRYVQFEREYYRSTTRRPERGLQTMQGAALDLLRLRQKGGTR